MGTIAHSSSRKGLQRGAGGEGQTRRGVRTEEFGEKRMKWMDRPGLGSGWAGSREDSGPLSGRLHGSKGSAPSSGPPVWLSPATCWLASPGSEASESVALSFPFYLIFTNLSLITCGQSSVQDWEYLNHTDLLLGGSCTEKKHLPLDKTLINTSALLKPSACSEMNGHGSKGWGRGEERVGMEWE